jgi:DNA-binding MarR family transcriptional regulator
VARTDNRRNLARKSMATAPVTEEKAVDPGILRQIVGYNLRRAQIGLFKLFSESFSAVDIRPTQFSILVIIEANPGLKQSELSAALSVKRTNMVALLDRLEERGLIRREISPLDRRAHGLYLTEQGVAFLADLHGIHRQLENHLAELLGAEGKHQLLRQLRRLNDALAVDMADGDEDI